ncbi:condensation domain-containing protein [Streptomyces sp. 35G-GA-8]|uniref:condensation domain-containing protein n=1 Tax=Streptomyces sp. 35G-GA-8 TaxID=2939434 RepID=UPI00201F908F|nr:condensation domain-containing protein [Streptomyces sp. 35G-GA-8]MCL7381698.1 condensation domain-containing protein [Streptomyces sp. 35G-GA-8]
MTGTGVAYGTGATRNDGATPEDRAVPNDLTAREDGATPTRPAVAVIGIATRFPGADNLDAFRANLLNGVDSVRPIPPERVESTCLDPSVDYPELGYLDRIDLFDHEYFGLSRREAEVTDPQHRLALELTHEALENAGYAPEGLRDSQTAVIFSSPSNGYAPLVREQGTLSMIGNIPCGLPARVSHIFGLTGPCYGVDTGCNGSLVAVHQACRELRDGDARYAVAGGVSLRHVIAPAATVADFPGISSPTARSRAFDHAADGAGGGEGGAVLLLTTLEQALADGAFIHAVIRGSAVVHNGRHSATISTPSARSQAEVIRKAWRGAGLDIATAGYVETHGSGTRLGDAIEVEGLTLARPGDRRGLAVGSVKTNLGHLDHAAGIAGLVKTILSVRHGELYPSLHFERAPEEIDLDGARLDVVTSVRPWRDEVRRAGVSSFSLGGINAHCVVEQAPPTAVRRAADTSDGPAEARLVGVSARTPAELIAQCERLSLELRHSTRPLADIARTLNEGREHHPYRVGAVARRTAELAVALAAEATWQRLAAPGTAPSPGVGRTESRRATAPRVVFLFSGDADPGRSPGTGPSPDPLPERLPVPADRAAMVRAQLAAYTRLTRAGVAPDGLMSSGISRYTVRHLQNTLTPADTTALERATSGQDPTVAGRALRLEQLRAAADEQLESGPVVFVELAARGELGERLSEYLDGRPGARVLTLESGTDGVLDVLARLYELRWDPDWPALAAAAGERGGVGRRVPLPGRPLRGVRCWARPVGDIISFEGFGTAASTVVSTAAATEAATSPAPTAAPAPAPAPAPGPAPVPAPVHVPAPRPVPASAPVPVPVVPAAPEPVRAPVPEPVPEPGPSAPSGSQTVLSWLQESLTDLLRADEVPADADYFTIGGNSVIALQLVQGMERRYGAHLKLVDIYDHPIVGDLADALSARLPQAPPEKGTWPELSAEPAARDDGPTLPPILPGDELVLSYGQERMWFHHQLDPTTTLYNLPGVSRHRGPLDPDAVRLAWEDLAQRHETLRSNFVEADGRPRLVIRPRLGDFFRYEDVSADPDPEAAARAVIRVETGVVFDLARDSLVRVTLVRVAPDEYLFCWAMHHAVNDGWAPQIQMKEFLAFYTARLEGRVHRFEPLPVQYRDYARWQRELLEGSRLDGELDYWRGRLSDPPALELPTDRPRATRMDFAGASHGFTIPGELVNGLRAVGGRETATLFMVLLTGLKVLLSRWSGQRDIVIGTPTIGRSRPELWGLLGFFNNTIALRSDLSGDPTFRELLRQVRGVVLGALDHQEIPFDKIVREVAPERDPSRNPIFDVMYVHQTLPAGLAFGEDLFGPAGHEDTGPYFPGLPKGTAKFDLTVVVAERAGEESLDVVIEYATQLFDAGTVEALSASLMELLGAVAANEDTPYGEIPVEPTAAESAAPSTPAPVVDSGDHGDHEEHGAPVSVWLELRGEVDGARLRTALRELAERHAVLRPVRGDFFTAVDTSDRDDPPAAARELALAEARRPVEPVAARPLRALLITTGPTEHILVVTTHPAAYDGGQPGVFFRDLFALYGARLHGHPARLPALPEPPVPYDEYARPRREPGAGGQGGDAQGADAPGADAPLNGRLDHWKHTLAGLRAFDLPADRPRPLSGTGACAAHTFLVPAELAVGLGRSGAREGLLAGIATLLALRSETEEAVIGLTTAPAPDAGESIGPFARTLPLRIALADEPSFDRLTGRIREVAADAENHRDVPLAEIVRAAGVPQEPGRAPLFDVVYAHHRLPAALGAAAGIEAGAVRWPGEEAGRLTPAGGTAGHDLVWSVVEGPGPDALQISVEYRTEMFDASTVAALADDLVALLRAALREPAAPLPRLWFGAAASLAD